MRGNKLSNLLYSCSCGGRRRYREHYCCCVMVGWTSSLFDIAIFIVVSDAHKCSGNRILVEQ